MSTSVKTQSVEETRALGRRIGATLEAGDVVGLEGDLGTGKTELVKGIAEALGVTAGVHSPTFVLHHQYRGRLPVEHYDLYRLAGRARGEYRLSGAPPAALSAASRPGR